MAFGSEGFRAEYSKQNQAYTMPDQHSHSAYEIYYLLSGERYFFVDDRVYFIHQGDLVLIPQHAVHRTTEAGTDKHERVLITFQPSFIAALVPGFDQYGLMQCFDAKSKARRLTGGEQRLAEELVRKLVQEAESDAPDSLLYQRTLLLELLVFCNRLPPGDYRTMFNPSKPLHSKIHRVIRYVRKNYSEPISLATASQQFFISPFYLSRVFHQVTGLTFVGYLNAVRIKAAQRLLRESAVSMTEIAHEVGYSSQTHFGRVFKRISGTTPLQYRKRVHTKSPSAPHVSLAEDDQLADRSQANGLIRQPHFDSVDGGKPE